jgi:PHD/YefM family antitoxin component YafN of YafNO toxin-antitoxin module
LVNRKIPLTERGMIQLNDTYALSDFQRNTREHIERLKESGRPTVLTVDGKAELVVQDVAAYDALLDAVDQAEAIIGIQRGLRSFERGEGIPLEKALQQIRDSVRKRD